MQKVAGELQAAFSATVVDEWVRAGVRHAVVAPGSRSTPLALALSAREEISLEVRLDERSAGFCALGIGLSTRAPAVVLTSSGTAVAELHAAVIEAHHGRVPLIVCTADRPHELQAVGAPQTIDQRGIYGSAVRFELEAQPYDEDSRPSWRSMAARLYSEAVSSPLGPGPVHVNLPFREPFDLSPGRADPARPDNRPYHHVVLAESSQPSFVPLEELVERARRPLIVAGGRSGHPARLLAAARRLGWPVLADPRSGLRRNSTAGATVVAAADSLLRSSELRRRLRPDLVVRLGESWASKALASWLEECAAEDASQVLVDPFGEWRDPSRLASLVVRGEPAAVLDQLASKPAGEGWQRTWQEAEEKAQQAIDVELAALASEGILCEPAIARALGETSGLDVIFSSSSMPVRDLEWFSRPRAQFPDVFSNRGANGIDGVSSTTLGVALGRPHESVVGLLGDLAFFHDLTALLSSARRPAEQRGCGLVVIDNGGGGIFSYLPQASGLDRADFERLFRTPQQNDPALFARASGALVSELSSPEGIRAALDDLVGVVSSRTTGGVSHVLVCRTDGGVGPAVHDRLNAAVERAVLTG